MPEAFADRPKSEPVNPPALPVNQPPGEQPAREEAWSKPPAVAESGQDHSSANRAAIERLLNSSRAGLHAYTRSILNTIRKFETALDSLADDILHDAVERAWTYIAENPGRPITNPEAFLHTIIYNGCITELRKLNTQKTQPSGEVDMAEKALEGHPFFKDAPETPEEAMLTKEDDTPEAIWDFVFHGKALTDGVVLSAPKGMRNFERNLEIFKSRIEGASSEDIVRQLQAKGHMSEYDLNDQTQRKKAINVIDQVSKRMLEFVREELGM